MHKMLGVVYTNADVYYTVHCGVSFIRDAVVSTLGMRRTKHYVPLKGTNNVASDARYSVNIQLCFRYSKFEAE